MTCHVNLGQELEHRKAGSDKDKKVQVTPMINIFNDRGIRQLSQILQVNLIIGL